MDRPVAHWQVTVRLHYAKLSRPFNRALLIASRTKKLDSESISNTIRWQSDLKVNALPCFTEYLTIGSSFYGFSFLLLGFTEFLTISSVEDVISRN